MKIQRTRRAKKFGCKIKPNLGNMIKLSAKIDVITGDKNIDVDDILDFWNECPEDMVKSYRQDWNFVLSDEPDIFIHPKN